MKWTSPNSRLEMWQGLKVALTKLFHKKRSCQNALLPVNLKLLWSFHGLVVPLCGTGWDRLDWDRFHRGYRACPATGTGLQGGMWPVHGTGTGLFWPFPVPVGQVWYKQRTCPTETSTTCSNLPVPLGQVVRVPVGHVWYSYHPSKVGTWSSLGSFLIKKPKGS